MEHPIVSTIAQTARAARAIALDALADNPADAQAAADLFAANQSLREAAELQAAFAEAGVL